LYDRDDGGHDTTDEYWVVDPVGGTLEVGTERIPFTCILPKESDTVTPPYDVAIFGHGYGSSRFDTLGFAHAFNRLGMAACGMDFPGHGVSIDDEDLALIEAYLAPQGFLPFAEHLFDDRAKDLTNDGKKDSGFDQWISDGFHTRDMVRQAAVDWMMMIRSFQACGKGTMTRGDETVTTCDWDADGRVDLGGPNAKFYLVGGSLGGINSAVLAAVEPSLTAVTPIVGGGGLMDVGARTALSGAVEAVPGRLMSPIFLGYPTESGGIEVFQHVSQYMRMQERRIGTIDEVPGGGTVTVYNLDNGETRQTRIPDDGRFRVGLPCDALDAYEKREVAGIPHTGPEFGAIYTIADTSQLGDRLRIHIQRADGRTVVDWTTWQEETTYEGITMPAGSELVALSEGLGHQRGSPDLRRLVQTISLATEPGDPISYAPHYFEEPFEELWGEKGPNVLLISTPGDSIVSINAQIALARAAGLIEFLEIDERYGTTVDRWLIENEVVRGLEQWGPFLCNGSPCLFDPDDLDEGLDGLDAPSDEPLRATVETDWGVTALRMPYIKTTGSHGPRLPDPTLDFDINTWFIYQVGHYFINDGKQLTDDHCMEDASCEWIPQPEGSR
jgi:pimeloyl-ACP methyl ester carboxylesterase